MTRRRSVQARIRDQARRLDGVIFFIDHNEPKKQMSRRAAKEQLIDVQFRLLDLARAIESGEQQP